MDDRNSAVVFDAVAGQRAVEGYVPLSLVTGRGSVECRYYPAAGARRCVAWVGGVGGGFDTPAGALYPTLASQLTGEAVASLRVRFRNPADLDEAVHDLRAGVRFLAREGMTAVALVGHSFGGAVVLQVAGLEAAVRTVICLAAQSYGGGVIATLQRTPVLLVHGLADPVLPPSCSRSLQRLATGPVELVLLPENGHCLEESAERVHRLVREWILMRLPVGVGRW